MERLDTSSERLSRLLLPGLLLLRRLVNHERVALQQRHKGLYIHFIFISFVQFFFAPKRSIRDFLNIGGNYIFKADPLIGINIYLFVFLFILRAME